MSIQPSRILYSDDYFLAVSKLSGELTVRGKGKVGKLPLFDFLKKDEPGLRVLHRLDFETSGVTVFARTKEAAEGFVNKKCVQKKVYRALVAGQVRRMKGVIKTPLPARSAAFKMQHAACNVDAADLVPAVTTYKVLERFANSTYVECVIETGRHHQIRRHFASIGHPLVLDHVYGEKKFNSVFRRELGYRRFFLHASEIKFVHPVTGEEVEISAPLPKAFGECVKVLRG